MNDRPSPIPRSTPECLLRASIRWILFDAVGTLIDADPPVAEVYHATGLRFGSQLSVKEISDRFRQALVAEAGGNAPTNEAHERDRWRRIVGRVIDDVGAAGDAVFEHLWQHFAQPRHWRLYDEAAGAITDLCNRGFRLGIASNFDHRLLEIVRGYPPLALCDQVFVSSEVGFAKPDLRFFRSVEQRIGAAPAEIALVGDDALTDVQGAAAAGWQAVYLDRSGEAGTEAAIRLLSQLL